MRITLLSTLYPFRGGMAQFNGSVYRELEKNNNIEGITFKRQYPNILFPGKTQYVTDQDVTADPIAAKQWLDSINPINWWLTARKIKKTKPDLLLVRLWMPFFGPCMGFVAKRMSKNTKVIAMVDNVIPHERRFIDMPFLKYFLKRTDAFVVMTEKVKDDLLKLKPDAKYVLTPHPIYCHFGKKMDKQDAQKQLKLQPNKKTIMFFGFIRDYKGLDLLLDAFDTLSDEYQLLIAGEPYGSFDKYQEQIEKNKNKDRIVKHVRYINDNEVSLFFSSADACVLPYKSATQSGITSIAYHFELPMIATNVGGLQEMVKNDITGKIIDKPDVRQIAKGIEEFFSFDQSIFVENIKKEKEKLSWKVYADKIIGLYSEIKD